MATFSKFNSVSEAIAEKSHDLGSDQIVIALTNSAPSATDTQLSDITEITYTNCSARAVTTSTSTQSSGDYQLTLTDLTLSASGGTVGPFQYVVVYNDTATNDELLGFYDYGSAITLNDGDDFKIDFDGTNGFLQINFS